MEIFGFSEVFHLSNKNIVFAKQQLFHSAPRALSLGWIAFRYFGVSDIALYQWLESVEPVTSMSNLIDAQAMILTLILTRIAEREG